MMKFDLTFSEREDGTKFWLAKCVACGFLLCGERQVAVALLKLKRGRSPEQFKIAVQQIQHAWETAKKNSTPIVYPDDDIEVVALNGNDLQRALEAHACHT